MGWKKMCFSIIIAGILSSFLYMNGSVFSSDAYFTQPEIKRQILHAIEECRESVDIAVLDITSNDIVNALFKAQKRGVQVRIVIDRKRALSEGPLSGLYKNNGFAIKALVQKGRMFNNFAIIDSRLLIAGSYYWNEKVGKFNHYNAIFTEEPRLLVKYQKEFDRLFQEGKITSVKEGGSGTEKKGEKAEDELRVIIPKASIPENQIVVTNFGVVITETPSGYIDMSFEEFNNVFGVASELSDEQKESLWSRCEGKKVKWHGKVTYIGWGLITGWRMNVNHGDTGVDVKLNPAHKDHFSPVQFGNIVTYTGKLDSRVTRIFPYKLEDGDVLEIEQALPTTVSPNELFENPDVVPISQGPKKIFLVDSFEDLDNLFGKGSNLSNAQKDEAWEKYEGKYVSWTGQIVYKNLNVASGLRMGIRQKERGDVELKIGLAKKDKVLKFQEGETVFYTGKLVKRCGSHSPYILEDGDIMITKEPGIGVE